MLSTSFEIRQLESRTRPRRIHTEFHARASRRRAARALTRRPVSRRAASRAGAPSTGIPSASSSIVDLAPAGDVGDDPAARGEAPDEAVAGSDDERGVDREDRDGLPSPDLDRPGEAAEHHRGGDGRSTISKLVVDAPRRTRAAGRRPRGRCCRGSIGRRRSADGGSGGPTAVASSRRRTLPPGLVSSRTAWVSRPSRVATVPPAPAACPLRRRPDERRAVLQEAPPGPPEPGFARRHRRSVSVRAARRRRTGPPAPSRERFGPAVGGRLELAGERPAPCGRARARRARGTRPRPCRARGPGPAAPRRHTARRRRPRPTARRAGPRARAGAASSP